MNETFKFICLEEKVSIGEVTINQTLTQLRTTYTIGFIVLYFVVTIYIWRKSIILGLSIEIPIKTLLEIINIDIENLENEDYTLNQYSDFYTSAEIQSLYKTMIHFVNSIKYCNNKLLCIESNEASTLISLSQSKQFYREYENLTAVGICANNISRIHMRNQRFFEAMNEQEQSIIIASQELEELRQYKALCLEIGSREKQNLIKTLQRFKNKLTQKFREFDSQWLNKYFKKTNKQSQKLTKQVTTTPLDFNTHNKSSKKINQRLQQDSIISNKLTDKRDESMQKRPMIGSRWLRRSVEGDENDYFASSLSPNSQRTPGGGQKSPFNQNFVSISALRLTNKKPSSKIIKDRIESHDQMQMENIEAQEKLLEIKKQKNIIKRKILNRKFQLASILFRYSLKEKTLFAEESKMLLTQIFDESKKFKETKSLITLQVSVLTKQVLCLIKLDQSEEAMQTLLMAERVFDKLKNKYIDAQINVDDPLTYEDTQFVDLFSNTPFEVLQEKIRYCRAYHDLLSNNISRAITNFVSILDTNDYFDPEIQKSCIYIIKSIFQLYDLPIESINKFENSLVQKDLEIIVLIDYTVDMSSQQLTLAHTMTKYILDQLRPQDQIGLYAFNEILYEAFPLQTKGYYRELLEHTIKQLLVYPGGKGDLLKLLQLCSCFLFDLQSSNTYKKIMRYIKTQKTIESVQSLKLLIPQIEQYSSAQLLKLQSPKIWREKLSQEEQSYTKPKTYTFGNFVQQLEKEKLMTDKPLGDDNEKCIDEILQVQDIFDWTDESEEEEKNEQRNFFEIVVDQIQQEEPDNHKIRYICLFSEGVKRFNQAEFDKLKIILQRKNVHLMIFNIANQNANMLYLKLLSQITNQSCFFKNDEELLNHFDRISQKPPNKRQYLEFF